MVLDHRRRRRRQRQLAHPRDGPRLVARWAADKGIRRRFSKSTISSTFEDRVAVLAGDPVAAKVRDARGLPEGAATTAFLDGVWD
jgi:hypothetical protein